MNRLVTHFLLDVCLSVNLQPVEHGIEHAVICVQDEIHEPAQTTAVDDVPADTCVICRERYQDCKSSRVTQATPAIVITDYHISSFLGTKGTITNHDGCTYHVSLDSFDGLIPLKRSNFEYVVRLECCGQYICPECIYKEFDGQACPLENAVCPFCKTHGQHGVNIQLTYWESFVRRLPNTMYCMNLTSRMLMVFVVWMWLVLAGLTVVVRFWDTPGVEGIIFMLAILSVFLTLPRQLDPFYSGETTF